MQFASFDLGDPVCDALGLRLSLSLVTLENLYGLDPERTRVEASGDEAVVRATRLAWAGGQERAEGELELRLARGRDGALRGEIRARAPAPIRCTKLVLRDLDPPLAWRRSDGGDAVVGPFGERLEYPTRLPAPLLAARAGERRLGLFFEDARVRAKRFALSLERLGPLAGRGAIELIHEEEAGCFAPEIACPPVAILPGADAPATTAAWLRFAEPALGLAPFETRPDVPAWARALRLVVTLHGMHWTGRVLLRYDEMLEVLRFCAERLPARHILAYLPGWEGRYYWQYGDYRPEPRLGGEAGFAALCDGARRLGAHVMPMFGANCANAWLPASRGIEAAAHLKSAGGNRFHGNQPDWDLSRAHDTGWQAWLNPGHPGWRERLAAQIEALAARFGFDGVFLDTVHAWTNDPDHAVQPGIRALAQRLRAAIPELLLAGEADYDGLLPLFPLFQRPWWEAPWTLPYVRRFAHLCEGEPRGRTGVHEFGVWQPRAAGAAPPGQLATLAFQDGTLVEARAEIETRLRALAEAEQGGDAGSR